MTLGRNAKLGGRRGRGRRLAREGRLRVSRNPDLDPAVIAAHHHISVRSLKCSALR
ncbi:hypothetical protein GCM10022419_133980 [Nonomuraea rosea]|uniref:Uncharacterized protein n=1 Tax=Nonomuraea rosea TaxID=638574 RepID=A0ABP7A602_9ACTN